MKVKGISLGWIVVKDLDAAIAFYTDVVGLKMTQHTPEFGWAEFEGENGMTLGIAQENDQMNDPMTEKAGKNAVMCVSVENLEDAIVHYKEKGAKFVGDVIEVPGHVKMQTFVDADGNALQLVEQISAKV